MNDTQKKAWTYNGENPTKCVRCKDDNTAEGYYTIAPFKYPRAHIRIKTGICKKHKSHGGSKITWY